MQPFEASVDSSHPHTSEPKLNGAVSAKSRRITGILLSTLLLLLLAVACQPPRPKCPAIPSVQRDFGDSAKRSGTWHVEIDLRGLFVDKYVRALLDQPKESKPGDSPTPTPTSGVESGVRFNQVWLKEEGTGPGRRNLIAVNFSVWIKDQSGNEIELPERTYTLWLRFVPYLITKDTVPDKDKRWAILECKSEIDCGKRDWDSGTNGIVLALDFDQLTGGNGRGPNDPVDCRGYPYDPFYDLVDEQVLTEALKIAATQKPIKLPLDRIVLLVDNLVISKEPDSPPTPPVVRLAGLDLGTDQHLKIGLVFDLGKLPSCVSIPGKPNSSVCFPKPKTFDSCCSEISRHSGMDWGVQIDTNLVRPAIVNKVLYGIHKEAPNAVFQDDDVKVYFTSDGLIIDANGIWGNPCGLAPFSVKTVIKMSVCTKDQTPYLRSCNSKPPNPKGCPLIAGYLSWIIKGWFKGLWEAHIYQCPPEVDCLLQDEIRIPLSEDVIYDHQKGVTLYGTQIDTDDKFFIGGVAGSSDSYIPLPSCDLCPGGTETVSDGKLNLVVGLLPVTDSGRFQIVLDGTPFGNLVGGQHATQIIINLKPGLHTVELTPSGGTVETDYLFEFRTGCNQDLTNAKKSVGFVTLHPGKEIICDVTVRNKNAQPILTIRTELIPHNDAGRFDISLDGIVRLSQAGDRASTGPMRMSVGKHTVTLTARVGTDISKYETDICFGGTIWLAPGDNITCTIRNTLIKEPNPVELCRKECQEEYKSCLALVGTHDALTAAQCRDAFDTCTATCQKP